MFSASTDGDELSLRGRGGLAPVYASRVCTGASHDQDNRQQFCDEQADNVCDGKRLAAGVTSVDSVPDRQLNAENPTRAMPSLCPIEVFLKARPKVSTT